MTVPVEHRFAAPGGEICWFEWGNKGQGPSLLLLHATGFHARCWDRVIASLPQDWHFIALDLRGHGRSYRPESLGNWAFAVDDVVALLDKHIAGPVFGIGHSMGGFVAALAAAQSPARFEQLLLIDPVIMIPEFYATPMWPRDMDPREHPVGRRRNQWESAEQMIAHFCERPPYAHWLPDVLEDYCRYGLLPAADGEGFELACPGPLEASSYIGNFNVNPYPSLADVRCPVTVLRAKVTDRQGPVDFSISPTNPELASLLPNARDIHWPEVSHFIPMEQPKRLAGLILEMAGRDQAG